jgi:endonuclease/exonuclease/phosphatase (EEP) superfamily protein YafD
MALSTRSKASTTRLLAVAAAWGVVLPLAVVALLRVVAHDAFHPLLLVNAFTPYVYLPAYAALVAAVVLRRRVLSGAAAVLVAAHLAWILPGAVRASPLPPEALEAPRLRVMSANLLMSNPDTRGIVDEVLAEDPDVLVVQELSAHWQAALESGEIARRLPYHVAEARETPFGVGLYSRYPLEDAEVWYAWGAPVARATVRVQGRPVRLYDVHPLPPLHAEWVTNWSEALEAVRVEVEREQTGGGGGRALVVAGDFNMTRHSRWFGRFTALGLRDAHEDRGRALATTWPNGTLLVPPIQLDHVFVSRGVACLSVREGRGRGSDHRPVLLDLAILDDRSAEGQKRALSESSQPPRPATGAIPTAGWNRFTSSR